MFKNKPLKNVLTNIIKIKISVLSPVWKPATHVTHGHGHQSKNINSWPIDIFELMSGIGF